MSLDLGKPGWEVAGVAGGYAMVVHRRDRRSRWIDLRAWPAKLLPVRDEVVLGVGAGATLVDDRVYTWTAPDKRRTAHALPAHQFASIGRIDERIVVVPGEPAVQPLVRGDAWRPVAGEGGSEPRCAAVVGRFVVWAGRVLRLDGEHLVATDAGQLAGDTAAFVATEDGFVAAGGGKLVVVTRDGKQREDRRIGKLDTQRVLAYEDALLVGDGRRYVRYDLDARTHAPFDLGVPRVDALLAAPCGLIGLVGHQLVRLRV